MSSIKTSIAVLPFYKLTVTLKNNCYCFLELLSKEKGHFYLKVEVMLTELVLADTRSNSMELIATNNPG